jgi:peptidoglycan hydrolase-like protein with peptidoglycan-binding domain
MKTLQMPWAIALTPFAIALCAPPSLAQSVTSPQKVAICLPFVGCTPDLPSIPGLPSAEELVKGELYKALAKSLGQEGPIVSSTKASYPTVDQLPGAAFNPTQAEANGRTVTLDNTGKVLLPAGDYLVPVDVFCMKHNASSPAGQRYLLAPLKGKLADVIAALNSRSTGQGINHGQIQVLSWNLQAGMKYDDMTPENRAIIDQLIPDHKSKLTKNFLETIESTYNRFAPAVPGMPSSINSALDRLGDVGKTFSQIRQVQSELRQYGNDYSALSRLLTSSDRGNGFQAGGEVNTPWSQIGDRLYGRLVTENGYSGPARLQLRALPGQPVALNLTQTVADPQTPSIQPLSMSPQNTGTPPKKEEEVYTNPRDPSVPGIKLKPKRQVFNSCASAYQAVLNKFDAYTHWEFASAWVSPPTVKQLPNKQFQASGILKYSRNKTAEYIEFSAYSWKVKPEKKKADELAWESAIDDLMVHELGHLKIIDAFLIAQNFAKETTVASASSEAGALSELEKARIKKTAEQSKLAQPDSDDYDAVTNHGATQSQGPPAFPGGKDVKFQCP